MAMIKPLILILLLPLIVDGTSAAARPPMRTTKSLSAALSSAKSASSSAWHLLRQHGGPRLPPAVPDCAILLADAVKQLQRSAGAMSASAAQVAPGDVQTWASAALTDENTCMEELSEAGRRVDAKVLALRRQVMAAAQLTSTALAMVNDYLSSRNHPRPHHPHHHSSHT